jgi:hypothetical protein
LHEIDEERMNKKLGNVDIECECVSSELETEGENCEDIEAETGNRNGEQRVVKLYNGL